MLRVAMQKAVEIKKDSVCANQASKKDCAENFEDCLNQKISEASSAGDAKKDDAPKENASKFELLQLPENNSNILIAENDKLDPEETVVLPEEKANEYNKLQQFFCIGMGKNEIPADSQNTLLPKDKDQDEQIPPKISNLVLPFMVIQQSGSDSNIVSSPVFFLNIHTTLRPHSRAPDRYNSNHQKEVQYHVASIR